MSKELSKTEVEAAYQIVEKDRLRRYAEDAEIMERRRQKRYQELLSTIASPSTHAVIFNDAHGSTLVYYESKDGVAEVEPYDDLTADQRNLLEEAIRKRFHFLAYIGS